MSAAFVQVAPDSTGKKVQSFENTVDGQIVEAQAVVLVSTDGTAAEQVPSLTTESTDGTVAAGATSVTFFSSSDFGGTILGNVFQANASISFDSSAGKTLGAFDYTIVAGTLGIAKVI